MAVTWMLVSVGIFHLFLSTVSGQSLTFNITQNDTNVMAVDVFDDFLEAFYGYLCSKLTKVVTIDSNRILLVAYFGTNVQSLYGVPYFNYCSFLEFRNSKIIECVNQNTTGTFDIAHSRGECSSIYLANQTCDQQPVGLVWKGNYKYSLTSSNGQILTVTNCSQVQPFSTTPKSSGTISFQDKISSISSNITTIEGNFTIDSDNNKSIVQIVIGVCVSALVIAGAIAVIVYLIRRRKNPPTPPTISYHADNKTTEPREHDYENEMGNAVNSSAPIRSNYSGISGDIEYENFTSGNAANDIFLGDSNNTSAQTNGDPTPYYSVIKDAGYANTVQTKEMERDLDTKAKGENAPYQNTSTNQENVDRQCYNF